jgi:ABC-type uncharacterized transport system ATPase subunit
MRLPTSGKVEFLGKELPLSGRANADGLPAAFRDLGIGHVPEDRLRDEGVAILLVSVELEEVRALADRIVVMSGGRITGELKVEDFDTTRIGLLMGGMHKS